MGRLLRLATAGMLAVVVLNGCAKPRRQPAPRMEGLSGPHFAFGKYELTAEGRAKVRALAAVLNKYPKRRVEVYGYTDSAGDDETNLWLSAQRAETVRQALIEDGVSANRIDARGYGDSNPVASDATAEGRAQNRRVEIILR